VAVCRAVGGHGVGDGWNHGSFVMKLPFYCLLGIEIEGGRSPA
jgi:hypothetical protein